MTALHAPNPEQRQWDDTKQPSLPTTCLCPAPPEQVSLPMSSSSASEHNPVL